MSRCRDSAPVSMVEQKHCIGCGVLRMSSWYNRAPSKAGLGGRCRPCKALYDVQRAAKLQLDRESQRAITVKWCSACELTLPAERFYKTRGSKDGRQSRCTKCRRVEIDARILERNKRMIDQTLVLAVGDVRVCSKCHICKPWAEFPASSHSNFGISSMCTTCKYARQNLRASEKVRNK